MKTFLKRLHDIKRDGLQRKPSLAIDAPETECINCGTHYRGRFCPACGQAASTQRLTLKDLLHNVFATIIAGDNVFFRTAGNLLYRPGHMVRDYLYGRRIGYFKPVQMLVRLVAVFVLLSYIFDRSYSVINFVSDDILHEHVHSESLAKAIGVFTSLLNNKAAYSLILAFVSTLPFKIAFLGCRFKRADGTMMSLNLAEHFFTLVYLSCLNLIISIIITPFSSVSSISSVFNDATLLLLIVLSTAMYKQLLEKSLLTTVLRCIAAIILTFAFAALLIILAFGIFYGIDAVQ